MTLLERDAHLEELAHHLRHVADGRGRVVLIGGEAGVGKSSLVDQFCLRAAASARVMRATCDSLSTPGPLGPLLDIGPALGIDPMRMLRPNQRREEVFHAVLAALRAQDEPTIIVGEDAHWSDEASIDLLRFISRRVESLSLLFLVTYRDDEIGPFHPLRRLIGDLASASSIYRMTLPPLTLNAVRSLAAGTGRDPDELFKRTGGNPFYLSEVLALNTDGVPPTVSDAVLARAARLSPEGRAALDVSAVIGSVIEVDLLLKVAGPVIESIEECLVAGLLHQQGEHLAFRHDLAHEAILATIAAPRRRLIHRRILDAIVEDPIMSNDLARLAHHAEGSGDINAIRQFAAAAAEQALALHSHREAAAQYRRLLRVAGGLPDSERALLLERYSFAAYLSSQGDDAISARRDAIELRHRTGDVLKEGDDLRWLSRLLWFEGRNAEAHQAGTAALRLLEDVAPGPELAMAYSNMAQLEMLRWNADATIHWGEKALELAERFDEQETLVHSLINIGTVKALRVDPEAWNMLGLAHHRAAEAGMVDHAGRALTNLTWFRMLLHNLDEAERQIDVALRYATEHDLDNYFWYLTAGRGILHTSRGRWNEALQDADRALAVPSLSPLTRIVALTVKGRILARRGDAGHTALLDEALALAAKTDELQRLGPVRLARAEAAWLAGDRQRSVDEVIAIRELADRFGTSWIRGEIAYRLHLAGEPVGLMEGLAEPYALMIAGNWRDAARLWERLGCIYERACALVRSDAEADIREAQSIFASLGARPDEALSTRRLREIGVRSNRRGPNSTTAANPLGLTQREMDVLVLLSDGLTNVEIAERLFISPKTTGHHVSAILAKLGVESRTAAASRAAHLGALNPQK